MSRDGLLPTKFQSLNKYQTPGFATIITGLIVGLGALFLQGGLVTDLTSIGTLFAFVLVSGGVLLLPRIDKKPGQFKLPDWSGRYWIPVLLLIFVYINTGRIEAAFQSIQSGSSEGLLLLLFFLISLLIAIFTAIKNLAFIPVMGVLSCLYLLVEIPLSSWKWFFVWMAVGLLIYFSYGQKNSKLKAD